MTATDEIPPRIARLPRTPDARNFVVPFFVSYPDGKPDFRVADGRKLVICIRERRCWVCGGRLTRHSAFVLGPMCTVTRTSAEPPSHLDCARYSVTHCPFLATPRMKRRDTNLPEGYVDPAGEMIERNPGCSAIWITADWSLFDDGKGGALIRVGNPTEVEWWAEGRRATREEVAASIGSGLPLLEEMARRDARPRSALAELRRLTDQALVYLPEEEGA